jgi:hypothetical protein
MVVRDQSAGWGAAPRNAKTARDVRPYAGLARVPTLVPVGRGTRLGSLPTLPRHHSPPDAPVPVEVAGMKDQLLATLRS